MTELDVQTKSAAPLLSVVVPVYNGDCSLAQTLDSVLQQDYDSYELVVVDDGSTDTSGEIIKDYARRYPDRVHAHHQANAGVSAARNLGIEKSRGSWIAFLDADDVFLPGCLESRARALSLVLEDTSLLFTDYYTERFPGFVRCKSSESNFQKLISEMTESETAGLCRLGPQFAERLLGLPSSIGTVAVTLRRSMFDDFGYFDTDMRVSQDVDMWYRALLSHRGAFLNRATGVYAQYRGALLKYEKIHQMRADKAEAELIGGEHARQQRRALQRRMADAYLSIAYKTRIPQGDLAGARLFARKAIYHCPSMIGAWRQLAVASLPKWLRRRLLRMRYVPTRSACPGLPEDYYDLSFSASSGESMTAIP